MGRRDAEREVIVVERGGSSFWPVLISAAVGAGLALLFAPQSGAKTRRALGKRLVALRDSAEEAYDELNEALHPDEEEDGEEAAEEGEEIDEESPAEASSKVPVGSGRTGGSPARRELEKRLAAARARRQRALAEEDEEPVA